MLAQITDLRLCALMSLSPYVSEPLCPALFCLRPYVIDWISDNRLVSVSLCHQFFYRFSQIVHGTRIASTFRLYAFFCIYRVNAFLFSYFFCIYRANDITCFLPARITRDW